MAFAPIQLSHFGAMILFALLVSVAFACTGSRTILTRLKYALWCFLLFLAIGVGVAWLMYPLSR
ncbi:MAG TPA: hypothetical protein VEJ45_06920 [Candidatus Acidoferrales bacterium]|nr:hypothetical protein [Candidatus Acidoferrales bacterium]